MSALIKTGVIGFPVSHSKSPLIQNYWINKYGVSGHYEAIEIKPENLRSDTDRLIETGYAGFNVTVPHKEAIMDFCATLSPEAKAIGAVNTVVIKDGQLQGHNTDAFGFIENIKSEAPDFGMTGKTAMVLGAGGAAKAVLYGLMNEGVKKIYLANRTKERAQKLERENGSALVEVIEWESRSKVLPHVDMLVNTTTLGMKGQAELEIDLTLLPEDALVNDIVYAPLMTDLLQQAQQRGNKIVTGIGMLLHQARPGFNLWYGTEPEVTEELKAMVLA